jgi:hypothetical protein
MALNINISETVQLSLIKEVITPNGELYVEGGIIGGQQVKQTLPNPGGHANLCYDPATNNFYWERKNSEDVRDSGVTIKSFTFSQN